LQVKSGTPVDDLVRWPSELGHDLSRLHPNAHLTHLIFDEYYSGLTFGGQKHTVMGRSWKLTDG